MPEKVQILESVDPRRRVEPDAYISLYRKDDHGNICEQKIPVESDCWRIIVRTHGFSLFATARPHEHDSATANFTKRFPLEDGDG